MGDFADSQSHACPVCRSTAVASGPHLGRSCLDACSECSFRFARQAFETTVDYGELYDTPAYADDQVHSLLETRDKSIFAHNPTYRPFFRNVPQVPGQRLLDVGCGVGRFCHAAHAQGWRVVGIDISPRAIEIGRRFAHFPLQQKSVAELVSERECFDVVTCFEVLEHLAAPREFLTTIVEVLTPGGHVFCTVPNWDCREVQTSTRPDWIPPVHLGFFTEKALRCLAAEAGFRDFRTGRIGSDPFPAAGLAAAKWCIRRLLGRPRYPLGLWLHARSCA